MIECEYTTTINGHAFSLYYDNRNMGWSAWLQDRGSVGWGINADDALADANARMGTDLTVADLTYTDHTIEMRRKWAAIAVAA